MDVNISNDKPNYSTYESEVRCQSELVLLTAAAQDTSGQAVLVCLKDVRESNTIPDILKPIKLGPENFKEFELKPFDDGMEIAVDTNTVV
jgi:3-deoxy-D-arabino-heptulosonate 7-phosphate (DAHP) synthase